MERSWQPAIAQALQQHGGRNHGPSIPGNAPVPVQPERKDGELPAPLEQGAELRAA